MVEAEFSVLYTLSVWHNNIVISACFGHGDRQKALTEVVFTQNFNRFIPYLSVIIWSYSNFEKVFLFTDQTVKLNQTSYESEFQPMRHAKRKHQVASWEIMTTVEPGDIWVLNSWTSLFTVLFCTTRRRARFLHKKNNFSVKINKNMTRERHYFVKRQKADETSECFNNIKDWVRWHVCVTIYVIVFLRMHTELTLLLKHSPYISTIFWPAFWVSTWSVKWYIRIKKLNCFENLFCIPQLHLGRFLKNA